MTDEQKAKDTKVMDTRAQDENRRGFVKGMALGLQVVIPRKRN